MIRVLFIKGKQYRLIPIKYNDKYYVSKDGKVYSLFRHRILKPKTDKDGYKEVCLIINNKKKYSRVHRLVCLTYNGDNKGDKNQVNHIDGIKYNNHYKNLEWVSSSENNFHRFNVLNCNKWQSLYKITNITNGNHILLNRTQLSEYLPEKYIKYIKLNKPHYRYLYFTKDTNGNIVVLWNGGVHNVFKTYEDAAKYYNKTVRTISSRIIKKKRKTEIYSAILNIKFIGNVVCNDYRKTYLLEKYGKKS